MWYTNYLNVSGNPGRIASKMMFNTIGATILERELAEEYRITPKIKNKLLIVK
jgi:hypothetical protein